MNIFWKYDIFWTAFTAWFIAQSIKVFIGVIREKRFNFRWFVGTGGMPSSHAATVAALTTAVGIATGMSSPLFCVTLVFTVVVLFDAAGVRRSSGKQAEVLNKIIEDMYWKKGVHQDRLKELIGHTPIEVLAGTVLGILVAVLLAA